ncbi:MAG: hypothetical protein ACJAYC_003845 [Halieaceae bacterium]|jgi:hypothetical protein
MSKNQKKHIIKSFMLSLRKRVLNSAISEKHPLPDFLTKTWCWPSQLHG